MSSQDVWFVGDWLDIVSAGSGQTTRPGLLMHWNGSSIQQTVLPVVTNVAHQYFTSVAASGPNDVWVAGENGTLRHYNGTAWSASSSGTTAHLYALWGSAANDVWAVGYYGAIIHGP